MFLLDFSPTYKWPVTFEVVGRDGEMEKHQFTAIFNRLKQSEIAELQAALNPTDGTPPISDNALFDRLLAGWEDVHGKDRKPLAYTPETRATVLDEHPVPVALLRAWYESLQGARVKNS